MSQATASFIDVRTIVPRERHPAIFGRFDALQPGETFDLVNDHDPRPLYFQMQAQNPDSFSWTYIESGPEIWRVRIGKTAAARAVIDDNCCSGGTCSG